MKFRKYLLLILAVAGTSSAHFAVADENGLAATLALEELVSTVVATNPELKFYEAEIAAAKGDLITAGTFQNPEASVQVGRRRDRDGGLSAEGTAWSVSVSQTFEYPGRISLRKAIAGNQVKLAELGLSRFKTALSAKARSLGYELSAKQELADAANEVALRGQELISILVQRDPAGVAPLLETRIIEASVIKLKKRAIEAQREAQSALFSLNQLRGAKLDSQIRIKAVDLRLPIPPDEESLVSDAQAGSFELKMQEAELQGQGFKVALSRNERWPSVAVGPYYSEEEAGGTERTFGIGLTVPLPVWNQNTGNIESAAARESQARTALYLTQRRIEQEVREKVLSYRLHLTEIGRWPPNLLDHLREAAEMGDRHYRLGALPVATYVELQEQYLEALEAIFETRADALNSIQDLEVLTGKTLVTSVVSEPAKSKKRNKK